MRITGRAKKFLVHGSLAAVVCTSLLAIANCTMVSDSLTGIDLTRSAASACLGECREDYREALAAERKRHQGQVDACKTLSGSDETACLAAESALNDQNVAQIKAAFVECQNGCHRQGSGTAG